MTPGELHQVAAILELVKERSGLSSQSVQGERSQHGVRLAMRRAGIDDPGRYAAHLRHHADAFADLMAELTVPETYFFRDPAHFRFIEQVVLPCVRMACPASHVFRAWSAGCASGEEAYSLAILLEEQGWAERSRVLATDISPRALAHGKRAIYGAWALRGVEPAVVARYFRRVDTQRFRLAARFLRRVSLALHNLTDPGSSGNLFGASTFDLVLCRNVLIYLSAEAIQRVASTLESSLAQGGWLITGPSDPLLQMPGCETLRTEAGISYRKHASSDLPLRSARSYILASHTIVSSLDDEVRAQRGIAPAATAHHEDPLSTSHLQSPNLVEEPWRIVSRISNERGSALGEVACGEALRIDPLSPALHYLHAALLLDLCRMRDADAAVRRVLYLDDTLAAAHFLCATIARKNGDLRAARRSYLNAWRLCMQRPQGDLVPMGDGLSHGTLALSAAREAQTLLDQEPSA